MEANVKHKIVQIAFDTSGVLHAVDENGMVWRFFDGQWSKIGCPETKIANDVTGTGVLPDR